MTQPGDVLPDTTHPMDHGVRAVDPDLLAKRYESIAHGSFRVCRTTSGRYYLFVNIETALGHLCAAIHVEREIAERVQKQIGKTLNQTVTGAEPHAVHVLSAIGSRADRCAELLDRAATKRGTAPAVLEAARMICCAHFGDLRARNHLAHIETRAKLGDAKAEKSMRLIRAARAFAREVLGGGTTTGGFFDDIGKAVSHVVRDVGHTVSDAKRAVQHTAEQVPGFKDVEHATTDVVHVVSAYGPMVLSSVDALCSMIPGIGTGISSALEAGLAILQGGSALDIAIHAAYGAIPIPPGLKFVTDTVVSAVLGLVDHGGDLTAAAIQVVRDRVPAGLPREVFDTLINIVAHKRPILPAAGALAGHIVTKYTQGATTAIAQNLAALPGKVQATLANLPHPSVQFHSIAQIAPELALMHPAPTGPQHPIVPQPLDGGPAVPRGQPAAAHWIPPPVFRGASLAIEVSVEGTQRRAVASPSLAHLVPAVAL